MVPDALYISGVPEMMDTPPIQDNYAFIILNIVFIKRYDKI